MNKIASRNGHLEVVKYLISLKSMGFSEIDPSDADNDAFRFEKHQHKQTNKQTNKQQTNKQTQK